MSQEGQDTNFKCPEDEKDKIVLEEEEQAQKDDDMILRIVNIIRNARRKEGTKGTSLSSNSKKKSEE